MESLQTLKRQNCICDYWAVVAVEEIALPLHRGLRNLDVVFLCRTGFSYLELMSETFLLSLLYSLASLGSQEIKMLDPRKTNARMHGLIVLCMVFQYVNHLNAKPIRLLPLIASSTGITEPSARSTCQLRKVV